MFWEGWWTIRLGYVQHDRYLDHPRIFVILKTIEGQASQTVSGAQMSFAGMKSTLR